MRAVTQKVVKAFVARKHCAGSRNTYTDGERLYLFGNLIVWHGVRDAIHMQPCVSSATTNERLNGLCERLFYQRPFHIRDYHLHFNGVPISPDDVFTWYPGITDAGQMMAASMMVTPSQQDAA